ncbi:MAG: hypothetical protein ABSD97_00800 [Acidimicrobiales bacterium]|jgi:hypothetical protein
MASTALPRRHVPFGGHQIAEYALAAALVVVGGHLSGRPELVLMLQGGLLALLAVVTKGPLAAWKILPRKLHVFLDLVLAACFAVSPVLYLPGIPFMPIIISEAVAVVLVRMSLTTELVPRPRPAKPTPGGAGATGVPSAPDATAVAAATAGRLLGTAVARARESRAPLKAARGLGRVTGHARHIGRVATAGKSSSEASRPVPATPETSDPPA